MLFVLMGISLVLVVGVPIYCRKYQVDKSVKVKTVGRALGLSDRGSKSALSRMLRELPLFSLGRSHTILYALEGERNGVPITVFELQSNAGSSDLRSEHGVYLLMRSHQIQSPAFALEPSDMHIGSAMKFDSHPKFHHRFWLKGHRDNEDAVRQLFTPTCLTFLLEERPKRFRLWGSGPYLLYSGSGVNNFNHIIRSEKLQAFLDEGLALLSQLAPDAMAAESRNPRPAAATTPSLYQAAASLRNQKITRWNPPKIVNFGKTKQKKRIAKLIADLVEGGGTYKPNVHGMGARTYESRQGKIIYIHPSEDPREARMRGQAAGQSQKEVSREGLEGIIQASAENFFPVLNPEGSDRIDQAMAEQLLAVIESQGSCNLTDDAYKISIEPINDRFIYQCDVPISRYQFQQVRRSFNRDDAVQWLMEHRASVFAEVLRV